MPHIALTVIAAAGLALTGCVATPSVRTSEHAAAPAMAAYFDCLRETHGVAISAHRGQSGADQPENSIKAITATGRAIPGAIVEIDAVLTKDGRLVLMHDDTLDRTTTGKGRVADLTLAEVKAARLRAPDGTLTDEAPPMLREALDASGRVDAIAAIDLKPADEASTLTLAQAVVEEVRAAGAADRVILITYSPETARAVAALAPEMMISAGLDDAAGLEGLNAPQVLAWTGTSEPRPALWSALSARGVEVQFGTLGSEGRRWDDRYAADGDASEYQQLTRDGAVVIATDTPLVVQRVLSSEMAAARTCRRPAQS